MTRPRIYQLFLRVFGNPRSTNAWAGDIETNGCGRFSSVDHRAVRYLRELGITHVWLTGVIRHATVTSHPGLPGDDPDVVKGRAGSPYAIKDYYDVHPDLADDPSRRRDEFRALLDRLHDGGLTVLLDFVPNHVSRAYAGTVFPERDFGRDDDTSVFFSPRNDFFHLVEPPGQRLHIRAPDHWRVPGTDGRFALEDGGGGRTPRATGNNQTSVVVGPQDWYETVKLNYGYNFVDNHCAFHPRPLLWDKMDAILAYWQQQGVDGFRCDFAHWVPVEFWSFVTTRARQRRPETYFLAEAYDDGHGNPLPGTPPGTSVERLITLGGFDAVYDHVSFNVTRQVASGVSWANDLDARRHPTLADRYCRYAENHDERRAASPVVPNGGPGDTGYGSPTAGLAASASLFLSSGAPLLFYAGQELGEDGAGNEGFGGEDGRTSIFDYWSPPLLRALHRAGYDVTSLPPGPRHVVQHYAQLIALAAEPVFSTSAKHVPLNPANQEHASFGDHGHWVHAFLRVTTTSAVLVAVNLHSTESQRTRIRIPREALREAFPGSARMLEARSRIGSASHVVMPLRQVSTEGLPVVLTPSSYEVFALTSS
ncbi:MAG: alpha-amylase family glycosyl hydrolase [Myxococcota bacterium]